MKISKEYLRRLVIQELKMLKGFGAEKDVEDVKAKKVEAEDLADTLEAKKDFTVESVKAARALKLEEQRLVERLAAIRLQKRNLVKKLSKKD